MATSTQISEITGSNGNVYMSVQTGKQEVFISQYKDGRIRVHVQNAMAKVWRSGAGRVFDSWWQARNAYKSDAIKSAIDDAQATAAVHLLTA